MQKPTKTLTALLASFALLSIASANSLVKNGDMTAGNSTPSGWALSRGVDTSTAKLQRDTTTFRSEPASLYLEANGSSKDVSIYQLLRPKTSQVTIKGSLRTEGAFTSVIVAAQVFDGSWKQLAWHNLAVINQAGDWRSFSKTLTLPAGAAKINLQLRIKGDGKVWLDDVEATENASVTAEATETKAKTKPIAWSDRKPIRRVETTEPVVALTFDDGPMDGIYLKMLDLFKNEGIHVTFFEIGTKIQKYPQVSRRALAEGHEIGSHSVRHKKIPLLDTMDEVRTEIVDNQTIIKDAIGVEPKIFRAPHIMHDTRMWEVLDEMGLPSIGASIGTSDWNHANTVESIIEKATVKTKAGDIVLMHSWSKKSLEALPEIIRRLREKGLRFVTVSELLALEKQSD